MLDMAETPERERRFSRTELLVGGAVLLVVPATVTVVLYLSGNSLFWAWAMGMMLLWWFVVGPILVHKYGLQ